MGTYLRPYIKEVVAYCKKAGLVKSLGRFFGLEKAIHVSGYIMHVQYGK
jgi:hypothetical protein